MGSDGAKESCDFSLLMNVCYCEGDMQGKPTNKEILKRKIKIQDNIPVGKGMDVFNLKQELVSSGLRIMWPQLLRLPPPI